jgi:hypothetical protein
MKLKFWQKDTAASGTLRMSKPKEIPDEVGRHLVVTLKQNPDWVWTLMAVYRDRPGGGTTRDMLIFDPKAADHQGVEVSDYAVLMQHPALILFEGWYDKAQSAFEIKAYNAVAPQTAA